MPGGGGQPDAADVHMRSMFFLVWPEHFEFLRGLTLCRILVIQHRGEVVRIHNGHVALPGGGGQYLISIAANR